MIPLVPPNVAAAGLKSAGSITAAVIGRYRPTGVPRTGSREDRAAAYQRLLDAAVHAHSNVYLFRHMRTEAGRSANKLLEAQIPQAWEATAELMSALMGVRLRGTVMVIAAAETLVSELGDFDMNELNDAAFAKQSELVVEARDAFLDAGRVDLAYDTKPYQVLRRRREKKFLRSQAAAAAAIEA
jgi:hypothetical protein